MDNFINIAITTSVTALIVLVVKEILGYRISPKWHFALWTILAIRLLIPVLPESDMSVFNNLPQVKNVEVEELAIEINEPAHSIKHATKPIITGEIIIGQKGKKFTLSKVLMDNVEIIWISGSILLFLYFSFTYFVYHMKARRFKFVEDENVISVLDQCKRVLGINTKIEVRIGGQTPLLKGIIKPEVILPNGYSTEELKSVFIHELTHYKYHDVLWNILSTLLLCAYWYNPIMWLSFFLFRRDMEILCDYRVLQVYNNKKEYASVLLKTAIKNNRILLGTTSLKNGEKDITKRIKYIANFKKPKFFWSMISIIIAVGVAGILLTNPLGETDTKKNTLDYEYIYENRTPFVGNASKVSNLTNNLYYAKDENWISLKTENKPYEIIVNYPRIPQELLRSGSISITDKMLKNASVMFSLIDNVDKITFVFNDKDEIYTFSFERKFFNNIMGEDIRNYCTTYEKFRKEFIPMIERKNWSEVDLSSVGIVGEGLENDDFNEVGDKVEKLLQEIMSSPKESPNPNEYILAHDEEYKTILKMEDEALHYMLSLFEKGETEGLKAHIMMSLSMDLLGDRNNLGTDGNETPKEWYSKLSIIKASKLPPFEYKKGNNIEKMVYLAAKNQYSNINDPYSVTIIAPKIFGTYENVNELKIFTTVYYEQLKLYGDTFHSNSGGIVPSAIIYIKNNDGNYQFKEYIEAKDASLFLKSIKEFCKPRDDIAEEIMDDYKDHTDLMELMNNNLINYLKENNLKGMNLRKNDGEIIPLT